MTVVIRKRRKLGAMTRPADVETRRRELLKLANKYSWLAQRCRECARNLGADVR
ncbi:hypothetical protein [Sinorhizobium medicae]|uniref:hypothetical protein n=1 Tax=Sinorhizobium medicae TaxID=110321 RepID=UPI0013E3AD9A|nr:hypothetical protein [Sinorhizobium medicae]